MSYGFLSLLSPVVRLSGAHPFGLDPSRVVALVLGVMPCFVVATALAQEKSKIGLGKVLLSESKIPVKVVAKQKGLNLFDAAGLPAAPFKANVPYFVFEEKASKLRVGRVQDGDVAKLWARKDDCYYWLSRRLAYPKDGGGISRAFAQMFGEANALPEFNPSAMVPWPILDHAADNTKMIVLYHPSAALGGESTPIDVRLMEMYEIYVVFTQTELDKSLTNLLGLEALLGSGKLTATNAADKLGKYLTQNDMDFLDVKEVKKTLDLFPGGTPSYLLEANFKKQQERIRESLPHQIDWIKKVADSNESFNEEHGIYIVPLDWLIETRAKGE